MIENSPSTSSSPDPDSTDLSELRLLHLADSALPIGALSHSFGLESLTSSEILHVGNIPEFLRGYLEETGTLEAVFCRDSFRMAARSEVDFSSADWLALNHRLSSLKSARESRGGSAALGRNFLVAVAALGDFPVLTLALQSTRDSQNSNPQSVVHHSVAFGLAAGTLGFPEDRAILAYLHQSIASLVSTCQRLLPLGQSQATKILWNLKPAILEAVSRSAALTLETVCSFTPLLEWGGMEHPALATRLFIS